MIPNMRAPIFPSHTVKWGGSAWTKWNKENHFPNKQNGVSFCFIWMASQRAQSCKELTQTDLRYSTAEGTENNEAEESPLLFSFYIPVVNMSRWSHIRYTNTSSTYTHMDVRAHKSTVGCILDLPSSTSQPPLFKHPALTVFHNKTSPTQAHSKTLTEPQTNPAPQCSPPPSRQSRPLPRA